MCAVAKWKKKTKYMAWQENCALLKLDVTDVTSVIMFNIVQVESTI